MKPCSLDANSILSDWRGTHAALGKGWDAVWLILLGFSKQYYSVIKPKLYSTIPLTIFSKKKIFFSIYYMSDIVLSSGDTSTCRKEKLKKKKVLFLQIYIIEGRDLLMSLEKDKTLYSYFFRFPKEAQREEIRPSNSIVQLAIVWVNFQG